VERSSANLDPTIRAQLEELPAGQDASQTIGGVADQPATRRLIRP